MILARLQVKILNPFSRKSRVYCPRFADHEAQVEPSFVMLFSNYKAKAIKE